jgi:iron complex outermembrane recepter protein
MKAQPFFAMTLAFGVLAVPATSSAQSTVASSSERGFKLEEVTVTARRREESLQSTPIAITAISGAELEERGETQIDAVSDFAPNVNFSSAGTSSGSSSAAVVFIRGVGQNDFLPTTEPGVGIYVDGVYYGRTVGAMLDLLDLDRVEVLRGPQGTLFGRNTIGGAINITSRKPGDRFAADVRGTVGDDQRRDLFARADIPVSDAVKLGAAFLTRNRDGYVHRLDGVDPGGDDVLGGRLTLLWDVTSSFQAQLTVDGVREREESAPEVLLNVIETGQFPTFFNNNQFGNGSTDPACRGGGPLGNPACYNDQYVLGPFGGASTGPSRSDVDSWGSALNLSWNLTDALTAKSITAYRKVDAQLSRDPDGSQFNVFATQDAFAQDQFSQELQLIADLWNGRANVVTGLYYFTEDGEDFAVVTLVPPTAPLFIGGATDNENYAFFSELTYNLTDRLHLIGGVRYTNEEKHYLGTSLRGFGGTPRISVLTGDAAGEQTLKDDRVTWRASVSYDFTQSVTGYATASTGFKSGGWTMRITEPNTTIPRFGPEFVDLYEIGLKTELPEQRLRFNAAVFYSQYDDIQLDGVIPGAFGTVTFNGGDAELKGVEAELDWIPLGTVRLFGSVGYLDSEYTRINAGSVVKLTDQLIRAPEWTVATGVSYLVNLGNNGSVTPRLDATYKSRTHFEAVNTPFAVDDGFVALNLNVPYVSASGDWRVSVGVENLTDERYLLAADTNTAIGYEVGVFARPRSWSLTVERRF